MEGTAIVLTEGMLNLPFGKTTHGLIRGTKRYDIKGVVDSQFAGKDAGEVLDGIRRNIPVHLSVEDAVKEAGGKVDYCIIGVATKGGILPPHLKAMVMDAIRLGISIVNGLHQYLQDIPEFVKEASVHQIRLIDIRKPKDTRQLHFWTGAIRDVKTPRIAVLGTDCAIGKRTTAKMLVELCERNGIKAEMIYTGQTGWLQGWRYGFIFDTTVNDFISGELEHAIVTCDKEAAPDIMFIEGQSSLRNPSGPCGSEFILSGGAKGVILQHAHGRKCFNGFDDKQIAIPPVGEEVELISRYGARTLAVTLNNSASTSNELKKGQKKLAQELSIPVIRPIEEGLDALLPAIREFMEQEKAHAAV